MGAKFSSFQMLQASVKDVREWFEEDKDEDWLLKCVYTLVIPFLKKAISEKFKSLKESYRVCHENNEAPTVVHYTSVDTVIKMFRDYSDNEASYLRLYDTFHFNDPDEGRYLKLAKCEVLSDLMKKTSPCAYATSFVVPRDAKRIESVRDNLVFWRTYGREGTGCSLAIKIPAHRLYQVRYGETKTAVEAVASIEHKILDALSPMMDLDESGPKEQDIPALLREATAVAMREEAEAVLYLHKSKAYNYENEARVVKTVRSIKEERKRDIVFEYESSKNKTRHYYEDDDLSVENLLVTGSIITLGPCVSFKENMAYYLEHLKEKSGLVGPEVRQSEVSYRRN